MSRTQQQWLSRLNNVDRKVIARKGAMCFLMFIKLVSRRSDRHVLACQCCIGSDDPEIHESPSFVDNSARSKSPNKGKIMGSVEIYVLAALAFIGWILGF